MDIRLRERLRTHKVFTKDQCFYLNYHKISIKSYVLDMYKNRLGEAISNTHPEHMMLWRNIENYHSFLFDSDPRFPPFLLYMLGANLGSLLYGGVSVMTFKAEYFDINLIKVYQEIKL